MRLRRSNLEKPGFGRRRSGSGFRFLDTDGEPLKDEVAVERIKALDYLKDSSGEQMTAKDFRTWHGTLKAARQLAEAGPQPIEAKRKKVVAHAMKEVAELLGNTPAVARSSYVDPRVIEHFTEGDVVAEGDEEELLDLLAE